jgi:hypothetical protein
MATWFSAVYARAGGGADAPGEPAVRRATALVTAVMCLVAVSEAGYGAANGGLGEVPVVAALVVLPLLYVVPATRPLWLRHRYLLLAVQAALTYLPFTWLGANWAPSGWLFRRRRRGSRRRSWPRSRRPCGQARLSSCLTSPRRWRRCGR